MLVRFGALAQLGERIAGSDEVRGSIPLGSINKKVTKRWLFLFTWIWGDEPRGFVRADGMDE